MGMMHTMLLPTAALQGCTGTTSKSSVHASCSSSTESCNSGDEGALPKVDSFHHACHKHFQSKEQAEEFITDWIETYLEMVTYESRKKLQAGWRPAAASVLLIDIGLEAPHIQRVSEIERAMEQVRL